MKTRILALLTLVVMCTAGTFAQDRKILVAYFSWSGNTQHVAEHIARQTGGTLFRIEPVKPYPTEYTPCTEVAKAEKEQNARPAIKNRVADWDSYDTVFIGCPVWWWTAPMIINTFAESYNFKGKTVRPLLHLRLDLPRRDAGEDCRTHARRPSPERLRSRGPEYRRHHGMAERDQAGQVKKMELCRNIKWHADDTD